MPGQPLSKNILQVLLGGWGVLKSVSLMGKQKLFENKTFKAIMGSLIKQDSREERELVTSSVYLEICLVMLFPMITT